MSCFSDMTVLFLQREILTDILKMEEREKFRQEMMRRLIPERDTNEPVARSGQRNQPRPGVSQTHTSALRRVNAEARTDSGLCKPTWQKGNVPSKEVIVDTRDFVHNRIFGQILERTVLG